MRRRFTTVLLLAVVMPLVACGADDEDPTARDRVDLPGPEDYLQIELPRVDGEGSLRLADLAGRPAVVNFFASWCAPCVTEMPEIEEVKQQVGEDVAFVGVNVQDSVDDATELIDRTGVTWDIVRDVDGELTTAVGSVGMPTTVLLDAEGNIVERQTGALDADELRGLLTSALGIEVPSS